jgi:TolA-binding protein
MNHAFPAALIVLALAGASPAGEPPSPADDAFQAAANLFAAGRHAEASEAYAAFPKAHPEDARAYEARFMAAESLFRAGKTPESLKAFVALRADPRAAFREANALYLLGRPTDAAPRLRELVARKDIPSELAGPAWYFLARSLVAMGRIDEARKALHAAPKPQHAPALAYLAAARGDVEAAAFLASEDAGRGDSEALEAALAAYREASSSGSALVSEALFKMGELLRRAGRPAEAVPCYRRVADEFASNPVAPHARLGLAWSALAAGDHGTAVREAARVRKDVDDPPLAAEARFVEGTALLATGKYADAARVLEPLVAARDSALPEGRVLRRTAWAAVAAGRKDLAARAAKGLLALGGPPEREAEARLLAAEAELAAGRPAEAIAHLDALAALAWKKSDGVALGALASYRRAVALDMKGDFHAAAGAYATFRDSYPRHTLAPWASALAGRAHLSGGRPADAAKCFKAARAHFQGTPEESEILWGSTVAEFRLGSFVSMAGYARRIIAGHANSSRAADAAYWLGWWHLERGEHARSAERFRDAAGLAGKAGRKKLVALAKLEEASALEKSGDFEGAFRTAKALVTGPLAAHAPAEAVLWVSEALRSSGDTEEARRILDGSLERFGDDAERARLLYALGELARVKGKADRALELFEKAIAVEPPPGLRAAALLGKARCLVGKRSRREIEVILRNVIARTAGWPRAAAYVELGELCLGEAETLASRQRAALAERAARDFMLVVILYAPDASGEGARLVARALLGAARAHALLGRYVKARDNLEKLLAEPLYRAGPDGKETPEAIEARKLLEEVGLKASGLQAGGAEETPRPETPEPGKPSVGGKGAK